MIICSFLMTRSVPPCPYCVEPKRNVNYNNLKIRIVDVSAEHDQELLNRLGQHGYLPYQMTYPTVIAVTEEGVKYIRDSSEMTLENLKAHQVGSP